ncbi:diacylglycerol kinase family protein [bacterium]|nr:diacylglycerol kinase family protein [bacterium]
MGKVEEKPSLKKSFACAFRGVSEGWQSERNLKIHSLFALLAIILAFVLKVSLSEWLFLTLIIGVVIITEMINTAIEKILDLVCKEHNGKVRFIKDLFAGVVLVASIVSLIGGSIIFIPKILTLI